VCCFLPHRRQHGSSELEDESEVSRVITRLAMRRANRSRRAADVSSFDQHEP
jgi:hypothetical protein